MSEKTKSTPPATRQKEDNDLQAEVNQYCLNYSKDAFWFVVNEFPNKIKEIETLKSEFSWDKITRVKPDVEWVNLFINSYLTERKKRRIEKEKKNGDGQSKKVKCIQDNSMKPYLFDAYADFSDSKSSMIETNPNIYSMINRVKPYVIELSEHILKLLYAIEILEPKLQEGNNFGVEVQCKVFNDVVEIYNRVEGFMEKLNSYHQRRNHAIQTMLSNPQIEDYQISLGELDFTFLYLICRGVEQLYSSYTQIHDYVVKNIDKLFRPRDDDNPNN